MRGRALSAAVRDAFELDEALDTFEHDTGRDLSGYEDSPISCVERPAEGSRATSAGVG